MKSVESASAFAKIPATILYAAGFKINRRSNRVKIFHRRISGTNTFKKIFFISHFRQIAVAKKIHVADFEVVTISEMFRLKFMSTAIATSF